MEIVSLAKKNFQIVSLAMEFTDARNADQDSCSIKIEADALPRFRIALRMMK